jgi:hypothetical protein
MILVMGARAKAKPNAYQVGRGGGLSPVGVAMAHYWRMISRFLAVVALVDIGGCSASGPEPAFETAYSAVGAQVK